MADQTGDYPELTFPAIALGILQGIVMTAAFVYAGLKLGFTLGGSTIAAIMGFALLRGVIGRCTIVENNINQTIASGINTTGAGIIFTLPVLYMMGVDFNPVYFCLAAMAGSFLGVVVIIPLRKQMVDFDRLRFPSGTAVAAILKSPGAGREKAILLLSGGLLSCITTLFVLYNPEWENISLDWLASFPAYTQTAIYFSLMNIGAGLLAGRGGLSFALGGCLAFWILGPIGVSMGFAPVDMTSSPAAADALTGFVYGTWLRPLGIGMLIGGAFMGVIVAFPAMKAAFESLARAAKSNASGSNDEMPIQVIYGGIILSIVLLFLVARLGIPEMTTWKALQISFAGSVWIALAGVIVAQCTGMTDISPLSGLSLIAVTIMLALTSGSEVAAILIGVAVCVAISQCADMMQDLKTGYLIGGIPVRQQWVQVAVAWIGPIVAMLVLALLWRVPPVTEGAAKLALAQRDLAPQEEILTLAALNSGDWSWITAEIKLAAGGETAIRSYQIHPKTGEMHRLLPTPADFAAVDVAVLEKKGGSHGFGPGTKLPAPQAAALQEMVKGVKGGNAPVEKYITGGILGALLTLLPFGGLGVMVGLGMYLPFSITLGYGVGCLISIGFEKVRGAGWCEDKLVPFAAGLIIGEAMTALCFNIFQIFGA